MRRIPLVFALLASLVSAPVLADKININTADAAALELLDGVGAQKAAAIVKHREQNGPFKAVEALADVQGIGPATMEKNRDKIAVGDEKPGAAPATP